MVDFVGPLASLALLSIGSILALIGFNRTKDLLLVGGAWLTLAGFCLLVGFSTPPFSESRFWVAVVLIAAGLLAVGVLLKQRVLWMLGILWLWSCFALARGYTRGGWMGLIAIGLPSIGLPFAVLYVVSGYLLPLRGPEQHAQAFRSLLTVVLGTNFPYWLIHSSEWGKNKIDRQTQMKGNAFGMLLAGPGVVISRCDHAPVVSDGVKFKGVKPPGVSFTGFADDVPHAIDLREQLRAFWVDARTKDGIGMRVLAFAPFRIDPGQEAPQLGQPFPFRASAAFQALHNAQLIEHVGKGQVPERTAVHQWDDLPRLLGTRILCDIIAKYPFDALSAPYRLSDDPRSAIAGEFRRRLGEALKPCGIRLEGGGVSNLLPSERSRRQIFEQRIRSWQVHWVRHIMQRQAQGQSSRLRQIEKARAQAQVEVIQALSKRLAKLQETQAAISSDEIVGLFTDVISQMAMRPLVQRLLPPEVLAPISPVERKPGS